MKSKRVSLWITTLLLLVALPLAGIIVSAQEDPTTTDIPGFLGIQYEEAESGIRIVEVVPDSPAEEAGLMVDDIITAVNDAVITFEDVAEVISGYSVGDTITLDVERGDETLALEATLTERPEEMAVPSERDFSFEMPMMSRPYIGVILEDSDAGVLITQVFEGSPAEEAGIQVDDVITAINDTAVTTSAALIETVQQLEIGDVATLTITRGEEDLTLDVTLGERSDVPPMIFEGMQVLNGDVEYLADEGVWIINELDNDSPLAEAGLIAGDRITAVNGESLALDNLPGLLPGLNLDEPVTLTVERGDETLEIELDAANLLPMLLGRGLGRMQMMPPNFEGRNLPDFPNMPLIGDRARLGVTFVTLDETTATEYEVETTEGALITEVAENAAADQAGIQVGDIITAVNGDIVDTERTLADRIAAYEPGDIVTLTLTRDGEILEIEVTLGRFEQNTGMPGFGMNFGERFGFPFRHGAPDTNESTPDADL